MSPVLVDACVSLLAGGTPAHEELMGPLQLAVLQPQRRLFTLVSQEAIVVTVTPYQGSARRRNITLGDFLT
ncbi:hypothetical protein NHX12_020177 [Muraenolepis orangiensis]|uniref:Uncharacterized protein n=1 Tax=Muraenolepis orangiensis TaxID=630683 RepID=A0A9Q0D472_9TELE|nr:hypothetical protein NHX12_020177 [Muraenolepis orangiensis]